MNFLGGVRQRWAVDVTTGLAADGGAGLTSSCCVSATPGVRGGLRGRGFSLRGRSVRCPGTAGPTHQLHLPGTRPENPAAVNQRWVSPGRLKSSRLHTATGSPYKCCPPIREASNRELLWQRLLDGTIDCIVSDHSPSTLDLKDLENGDFAITWGGVSSLQLGLSLIWPDARHCGISLEQVVKWMSTAPAELVQLHRKGKLAPGYEADFAIFAADAA